MSTRPYVLKLYSFCAFFLHYTRREACARIAYSNNLDVTCTNSSNQKVGGPRFACSVGYYYVNNTLLGEADTCKRM